MTLEQRIEILEKEVKVLKRQLAELEMLTSRQVDLLRSEIQSVKIRAAG